MESDKQKFISVVSRFVDYNAKRLPDDVVLCLGKMADEERDERAKLMYGCMLRDIELAAETSRPVCQDTGLVQFFVEAGTEFPLLRELPEALKEAVERASVSAPLRPNAVEYPSENNTGTNTGRGVPYIEYDIVPDSRKLKLTVYMQGGGAALVEKGINACPPLVVGVGVAGCMPTAAKLAKHACLRKLGRYSELTEIAEEERRLKALLDEIAIGPQGVGGRASTMAVNIETACHHPSSMGVAVQFSCWAMRRGVLEFDEDLTVKCLTHGGF